MRRASTVRYTYADHQTIPEDHRRHEIVDGELFVTPTPRVNHQRVAVDVILARWRRGPASTIWGWL